MGGGTAGNKGLPMMALMVRSLRLVVFDRVPWARPNILHHARRKQFGGRGYDDRLMRLHICHSNGAYP
jgi:hypothetical protein